MTFAASPAFLDALRTYRVLEPSQLAEAARMLPRFPEPRALAKELIQRGWLTPYQVNQLFQGRGPDLLLGSYVILERLGEGGMGTVFKARNWKLGKIVALKVIRKDRLANTQAVRRFHREIRAAAQLNHPNIVLAYDADDVGGTHLFVMEYVQGIDLARLVQTQGPLPVDLACEFIRQAALGLQHAYESGLVHRDIKPNNLLATRSAMLTAQLVGGAGRGQSGPPSGVSLKSVVKLLDLGLARSQDGGEDSSSGTLTQEGSVMGTPDYLAPEQALNSHLADIRSDLYSLGCTFYFLLTGQVPYPGGAMTEKLLRHQLNEPTPLEQLRPEVPPGVGAIVRKLMAKRPDDRYQTPAELAAALGAGPASGAPSQSRPRATPVAVAKAQPVRTPFPTSETEPEGRPVPVRRPEPTPLPGQPEASSNPFLSLTDGHTEEISASSRHVRQMREQPQLPKVPLKWLLGGGVSLVLGVLVAVLVSSRGGSSVPNPTAPGASSAPIKIGVEAGRAWQDTGVDVEPGRQVIIAANGDWGKRGQAPCSAAGARDLPRDRTVLPTAPALCLLGRIGNSPRPFAVGALTAFEPKESGRLYLRINDLDQASDSGTLNVEINGGSRRSEPAPAPGPTPVERAETDFLPLARVDPLPRAGADADRFRRDLLAFRLQNPGTPQAVRAAGLLSRLASPLDRLDPAQLTAAQAAQGLPDKLVGMSGEPGWRHWSWVGAVAWSPDGKLVASGGGDLTIYLRDPATGVLRALLKGQPAPIRALAFSPDGKLLASGDEGGFVKLWDVAAGKEKTGFRAQEGWVRGLVFSPDGHVLATGGSDPKWQLKIWDVTTDRQLHAIAADSEQIVHMALAPDGKMLATGGKDAAKLWDLATGKELAVLKGHSSYVHGVAFSPDGKTLATAGFQDRTVRLWDLERKEARAILQGHGSEVYAVVYSADGRNVISASADWTLRLWDNATGKEQGAFRGHDNAVMGLACSPDGQRLASASTDGSVRLWDLALARQRAALEGHTGWTHSVAFSPDGKLLVSAGGDDNSIRMWDPLTNKEKAVRLEHKGFVHAVVFAPDGKTFASCSYDKTVKIWDTATLQVRATLEGHESSVYGLAYSHDGKLLASAGEDQTVRLWNPATGELLRTLTGHTGHAFPLAFSPDDRILASGGADHTVRLWDPATGEERAILRGARGPVDGLAFAPDGKTLAAGSHDRMVRLWDVATGRVRSILRNATAGVTSVAYTPDGRTLAAGLGDSAVWLWDLASQQVQVLPVKKSGWVRTLALSPDGKTLATAAPDKVIRLWDVPPRPERRLPPGQFALVRSVAFAPDAATLAAGLQDGTVWLCDAATGQVRTVLAEGTGPVAKLAFSADGKFLAAGMESNDVSVRVWDLATLKPVVEVGMEGVHDLTISADAKIMAVATNASLKLLETASGKDVTSLHIPVAPTFAAALVPDGEQLALIEVHHSVERWDLQKSQALSPLRGPGQILAVTCTPDGQTLITGHGHEGVCIKLWDRNTGGERALIQRPDHVAGVGVSSDGKVLATREGASKVAVWNLAALKKPLQEWVLPGQVFQIALAPDGRHIALANHNGTVYLLRLAPAAP